jgi:hypothetical protein
MATDNAATGNAVIVIAQAETGQVQVAPVEGEHAAGDHVETVEGSALEHAETGMPQLNPEIYPNLIFWLLVALIALCPALLANTIRARWRRPWVA